MNLADLKKKGGVLEGGLVAKEITWKHAGGKGKDVTDKFTVHIRRHAFGVMEQMFNGGEGDKFRNARYLSASVCLGADGAEDLPFDDAVNLDPGLGVELLKAVNEVNTSAKN